jgi:hypothetical protein
MAEPLIATWDHECFFCGETFASTYPGDDICLECIMERGEGVLDALEWVFDELSKEQKGSLMLRKIVLYYDHDDNEIYQYRAELEGTDIYETGIMATSALDHLYSRLCDMKKNDEPIQDNKE